jgi:hypothetical protein
LSSVHFIGQFSIVSLNIIILCNKVIPAESNEDDEDGGLKYLMREKQQRDNLLSVGVGGPGVGLGGPGGAGIGNIDDNTANRTTTATTNATKNGANGSNCCTNELNGLQNVALEKIQESFLQKAGKSGKRSELDQVMNAQSNADTYEANLAKFMTLVS